MNTIFFSGWSLFTSDRKVDTLHRTHENWFDTVFITIVNLYKYQNVLKSMSYCKF